MSVDDLARLTKKDLLLEEQLQSISKKSLPSKEMEGTPPTNLINTVQGDINLKDMAIEEQLQKISRNAIKDVLGWKPTLIKSDVTNEMIQEYQDEMANSFYDDPITGKKLKYVPVASDITLEEYRPHDTLESVGITEQQIRTAIKALTLAKKDYEEKIIERLEYLEQLKSTVEFQKQKSEKGFYNRQFLIENPELQTETYYLDYVQRVENEMYGFKARIFEIDGELGQLESMLKDNERVKKENQAEKDRVSKANYTLLKEKSDELNLLNRGQLNLTRQPNETDEDFRQRIIDAGQVEFDEKSIEQAAGRRAMLKFKENMKEITRNNILIENMIKSVSPSRLFLYNKFFKPIKTKFDEVYGKATFKDEDYPELINIFDNIIGKVNLSDVERPQFSEQELSQLPADVQFEKLRLAAERMSSKAAAFPANYEYPPDQTPAAEARLAEAEPIEVLTAAAATQLPRGRPALDRNIENPYNMVKTELIEKYKDAYAAITGGGRTKELTSNVIYVGKSLPPTTEDILKRLVDKKLIGKREDYKKPAAAAEKSAAGLKHDKLPKLAQFGKIMINPYALFYQNTLILTSNGTNHFTGYRNTKVSDDFVSIIMKILQGGEPTHKEIQKLDLSEKELYDNVIHLAHLHKKVDHNLAQTRQAMKHRFELLNGEIGAGNTNKALKKELTDLVHKMAYAGMISHHQRNKFVKSL